MPVIEVKNISFAYATEPVIQRVSFMVPKGSITMLIGPNGSGKTTLLKLLTGLIKPTSGQIAILGKSPTLARKSIGYVPQKLDVDGAFPITVKEFLELSQKLNSQHDDILESLGAQALLHKQIGELSGGQLQRVLIARSLLGNPKILFLDEPVSGIDIGGEQDFYQLMQTIRERHQVTIILVSHEVHIVSQVADQVICINKNMLCCGAPGQVLLPETIEKLYGPHAALYDHNH